MRAALAVLFALMTCGGAWAQSSSTTPSVGSASNPFYTVHPPNTAGFGLAPEEYFFYQGFEYVATTNLLSMPAGDTINIKVCNTYATGGKTLYVFERRFDNNTAYNGGALSYGGLTGAGNISDSTTYSSATAAATTAGNNVVTGLPSSTGMTMTYAVGTARLSGTVNGAGYLPTTADAYKLVKWRAIPPQNCFAQFITNPTAALGGATDGAAFTFYWWEQ